MNTVLYSESVRPQVLVTGGAGFIGQHLLKVLQTVADLRIFDNFRTGRPKNLTEVNAQLFEASILDDYALQTAMEGVDTVFHLAAMVSVRESTENVLECHRLNGTGTLKVLECAAKAGVRRCVFTSSSAIYGNGPIIPQTETQVPRPETPYAISKILGEYYASYFSATAGMETVALRLFNVFGPHQDPSGPYAAVVPAFIRAALRGEPLIIHGDGEQTRDFVYVNDVVAALKHFMTTMGACGTYNVGYGVPLSVKSLAEQVLALTGSRSQIIHYPCRAEDVRHSTASVEALLSTGFRPSYGFARGLKETILFARRSR